MDYGRSTPEVIARAIAEETAREVDYVAVETDRAPEAAERFAELLN